MIQVESVSVQLGKKEILRTVDCHVPGGEVTVLMGKNGAGKSTLLRVIAGLTPFSEGRVYLDDRLLRTFSNPELADYRAVLSQSVQLSYALKVEEVVEIGCYNQYHRLSGKTRKRMVGKAIRRLALEGFLGRFFHTLSGGEQKRVLLAKCLVQLDAGKADHQPQFLLLDEPTAALDVEQQYRFFSLARELVEEEGIGILAVVHDLNLAAMSADQVILMRDGRITAQGDIWNTLTPALIQKTFDVDCLIHPHPHLNIPLITTYGKHSKPAGPSRFAQAKRAPAPKSAVGGSIEDQ